MQKVSPNPQTDDSAVETEQVHYIWQPETGITDFEQDWRELQASEIPASKAFGESNVSV
jgi:hypothetical protein